MAAFEELLGGKLLKKDAEVDTKTALEGKAAVALYFSGHWCPPCRGFTPQLAKWYGDDLQAKGLEVIFVSSDRDENGFKEYYADMPWLALPFGEREKKNELSKKFKVDGIPFVVILDSQGNLMTRDGRAAISGDPKGEDMPWKDKTFSEIFAGADLKGPDGAKKTVQDLEGKVVGLYFSAHWCPPCRAFTPNLAEWYKTSLKDKGLEIVFISSDRDEGSFNDYFSEQPWLALELSDKKRKDELEALCGGVPGIPFFAIFDKDRSIITKEGRAAVSSDPTGDEFPWHPKPVSNLKGGPGAIQETTTVICFCETSDADTQKSIEQAMEPVSRKFKADAKEKGADPEAAFMIVTENSGLAPRIRGMLSLPGLPPSEHEHPLEKNEQATGWGCDGCGQSGMVKERFRCTQGCDYDLCGECNAKVQAGGSPSFAPKLMIVNIPDNGGYYEGPEGNVTTEAVQKLIDDYQAKSLERKQLS